MPSLNTDEAIVAGILRDETLKNVEVLMPLNAQMKGIDLFLMNLKNKKVLTVQVKGSRAFEPRPSEIEKFRDGSAGWFFFHKDVVQKATADYFIFLVYVIKQSRKEGRKSIEQHTITIPTSKLKELCKQHKMAGKGERYNFYFWVNPTTKEAFDFRDKKYPVSDFLDKEGFKKMNKDLN